MIKKKLKLDFYTAHHTLAELQPIHLRSKPPSWWKTLKNSYDTYKSRVGASLPVPTIKTCPGVSDYMRLPITLKLWSDGAFKVKPNGDVEVIEPLYDSHILTGGIHSSNQYGGDLYEGRAVCKLNGPWCVKASSKAKFMITECHYNEDLRKHGIMVSPGITNFNEQHTLNVFLVFPIKEKEYVVTLKYGTPLMSIYPMFEQPIDIEMHKCTRQEFQDIQNIHPSTFLGRYYAGKHARNK